MTPEQTRDVFKMILAGWSTQRQKMSEDDIRGMAAIYTAGLADLEYDVVKQAIQRVVRTEKWLPTIASIREAAGVIVHGTQTTGGEAWGAVVRALRERGSHRTPGVDFFFKDPITARVVSALGWSELCRGSGAAHAADRARFIDTYDQIAQNERTNAHASDGVASKALGGRHDGPETLASAQQRVLDQYVQPGAMEDGNDELIG
jgi:hypothetical protein